MSLVTDFTSADFNSYSDEAESDVIFQKYTSLFPDADWLALTSQQKEDRLLQSATEANLNNYMGELIPEVVSFQSGGMHFPRRSLIAQNGLLFPNNVIPDFIKEYQLVRSLELITSPNQIKTGTNDNRQLKSQRIATLRQEFFEPNPTAQTTTTKDELVSYQLIEPYLTLNSRVGGTSFLVRA